MFLCLVFLSVALSQTFLERQGLGEMCPGDHMGMMWNIQAGTWTFKNNKLKASVNARLPSGVSERAQNAVMGKKNTGCCLGEDLSQETDLKGWIHCDPEYRAPNTQCSAFVTVSDPDPRGLNIRESPSTRSPVISRVFQDYMVRISETRDGWFRITESEAFEDSRAVKLTPGWANGRFLTVNTNEAPRKFYDRPSKRGTVVQTRAAANLQLRDCRGDWLFVHDPATGKQGWLALGDYCGNPVTTCS